MSATHGEGAYGNATGVTTPTDHKMAQVSDFVKTGVNTIRPGLLWDGNATVITGKANMSYDVRAFSIVTQRSATSGVMKWANDATVNVATTAAPGSNSRYDVVYAWHREFSLDGTNSDPVIGVVQGTSAASPTVPSLAAFPGAVQLATILVPAGVTATNSGTTITQTAPFTTVDGGIVVARTTTERDAYTPAAADIKAKCFVLADGVTYKWNGSAWKGWESDWIAYTPSTIAGISVNNGSSSWSYKWVAGDVRVKGGIVLGSASVVGGAIQIALPVSRATLLHNFEATPNAGVLFDVSAGTPYLVALGSAGASTTSIQVYPGASGPVTSAISSTIPFTWTTGDAISVDFTYRAA